MYRRSRLPIDAENVLLEAMGARVEALRWPGDLPK